MTLAIAVGVGVTIDVALGVVVDVAVDSGSQTRTSQLMSLLVWPTLNLHFFITTRNIIIKLTQH